MKPTTLIYSVLLVLSSLILLGFYLPKNPPIISDLEKHPIADNHEELGAVEWLRDYDLAIQTSKKEDKPILLLFQEIPGCGTCKRFGNEVLSHPLIVDAIENEFIPLAIFNNKQGKDLEILKSFGEPAWNNPVVRIINAKRKDLTPRIAHYNSTELVNGMISALKKNQKSIPPYLDFLQIDLNQKENKTATYAMYCFWSGEAKLGSIDGVVSTKAGFMNGHEVVAVEYDPKEIEFETLTQKALDMNCSSKVFVDDPNQKKMAKKIVGDQKVNNTNKFRLDHEPKYYLSKTNYRFIPMLPTQASRINAAIGARENPNELLAPSQIELYKFIKLHPNKKWFSHIESEDFVAAWEKVMIND